MRISEKPLRQYPWYLRPLFWLQRRKYGEILKPGLLWGRSPLLFLAVAGLYGVIDRKRSRWNMPGRDDDGCIRERRSYGATVGTFRPGRHRGAHRAHRLSESVASSTARWMSRHRDAASCPIGSKIPAQQPKEESWTEFACRFFCSASASL